MVKYRREAKQRTGVLGNVKSNFPEGRYCGMIKITISGRILSSGEKSAAG